MPGAEAFVRYYNQQLNVAWSRSQTGLLPPLSMPGCKTCAAYEAQAKKGMHNGHHLDGPNGKILAILATTSTRPQVVLVSMKQKVLRRRILDRDDHVVGHTEGQVAYVQSEVRWTTNGWKIQEVRLLRP